MVRRRVCGTINSDQVDGPHLRNQTAAPFGTAAFCRAIRAMRDENAPHVTEEVKGARARPCCNLLPTGDAAHW